MEPAEPAFKRIAIVGLGLIGGSWALALKKLGCAAHRVGFDAPGVLQQAIDSGAVQEAANGLDHAVRDADLVILATPVGKILELLPEISTAAPPSALITDVGSTKQRIVQRARELAAGGALFLGGHPLAGKEHSGFEHADAELFRNACYAIVPLSESAMEDARAKAFISLIKSLGAHPCVMDADSHDVAVAYLSHMPQLLSTGLAGMLAEKAGQDRVPLQLAGSGFRDLTRLAESPYSMWRDICLTNTQNIQAALDAMIQKLDTIKTHLSTRELEKEFDQARRLRQKLREKN
ncbi:MAG TPA: prephenate dehydrogenase/arogenate dehydrogenase family protein [Terriglobia bacterium]|nr:prephenate dehydrogenase/arogenate dehydrogenase family protein [Terriglobia bacterium]